MNLSQTPISLPFLGAAQEAASLNKSIEYYSLDSIPLQDEMWDFASIPKDHWDQVYPYRLAVYKKVGFDWIPAPEVLTSYTLPFPPESLVIDTPFAINVTKTLQGVIEEHAGAPFRDITLSGTTGVLPLRGTTASLSSMLSRSILGGTLSRTVNAVTSLGTESSVPNVVPYQDLLGDAGNGTGYYQFKLLERFLESYSHLKTTQTGRNCVLALELWKDDQIYLCSPLHFSARKSAASPLETQYSLRLRAWRRVRPVSSVGSYSAYRPISKDKSRFQQALADLNAGRKVLMSLKNILKSVRADISDTVLLPIREVCLFTKDFLGVAVTAADLPADIISDLREPLLEFMRSNSAIQSSSASVQDSPNKVEQAFRDLASTLNKLETGAGRNFAQEKSIAVLASPVNTILASPDDYFDFFDTVKPTALPLKSTTVARIEDERKRVRGLKREDFEVRRDSIRRVLVDFENYVGLGDATYNATYGVSGTKVRDATDSDYDVIFQLNKTLQVLNQMVASSTINRDEVNPMEYFAGLARKSGIAFSVPKSKFLVPFPYGTSLERLALQYLGDANRWLEIAALNGLKEPYIDEIGFTLPLAANGSENTVSVADVSNLFPNQTVWVESLLVARTKRRITAIRTLSPTLHILTLSGEKDLDKYTLVGSPWIHAFRPDTVNSQMSLYIPSDEETEEDFRGKSIPGVDQFDPYVRIGGVDALLTPSGDLVVPPDGSPRFAVGLTNITQRVRLMLDTTIGSLLQHPTFGLPIKIGTSNADIDAKGILQSVTSMFRGDSMFTGVTSAAVSVSGPATRISLSVGLRGIPTPVPITVQIQD